MPASKTRILLPNGDLAGAGDWAGTPAGPGHWSQIDETEANLDTSNYVSSSVATAGQGFPESTTVTLDLSLGDVFVDSVTEQTIQVAVYGYSEFFDLGGGGGGNGRAAVRSGTTELAAVVIPTAPASSVVWRYSTVNAIRLTQSELNGLQLRLSNSISTPAESAGATNDVRVYAAYVSFNNRVQRIKMII